MKHFMNMQMPFCNVQVCPSSFIVLKMQLQWPLFTFGLILYPYFIDRMKCTRKALHTYCYEKYDENKQM